MIIDSHAHLDLLEDAKGALTRAREAGVIHVVTIGIDLESSRQAATWARSEADVSCTVGVHPHDAAGVPDDLGRRLGALARESKAVAIGECGLDYFRNRSPREKQRRVFMSQVELALDLRLPLVIHDRDAHEEVLGILEEQDAGRVGGVIHCFSGDTAVARRALDMGFHLGITGTITYPKNDILRQVACMAPLERLLVETDCPFLAPVPKRGKENEPSYMPYTVAALAAAIGISPEEAALATTRNSARLFGLNID